MAEKTSKKKQAAKTPLKPAKKTAGQTKAVAARGKEKTGTAPKKPATGAKKSAQSKPTAKPPIKTLFFTGFPGFLGRNQVKQILTTEQNIRFRLLVQEQFLENARTTAAAIQAELQLPAADLFEFLVGDLTVDQFGLEDAVYRRLLAEVDEVWHLGAAYDLAIAEKIAWNVNVEGTRRVLDLCQEMKRLQKLVYFSTCYVSGLRTGLVLEDELDYGQGFKNHYESTKFEAESLVRQRREQIPTVIIRPSIVIGDSRTGEADKYDGPYFLLSTLADAEAQNLLAPFKKMRLPSLGKGDAYFHLVPVDYLVQAVVHIAGRPEAIGRTFQICDPDPLLVREFIDLTYQHFGLGKTLGHLPMGMIKVALKMPKLGPLLAVPEEVLTYLEHHAIFDCRHTRELLKDSGIQCPPLADYLGVLIDYLRGHLDKKGKFAKY
ncbi:MAG: NAD-dependent epimerase/dehydratase family protein [Myxococcales bacterium]|nr:NAD-dependent epimerase/dehydratase family protein [Myxococcales bacterium]